MEVVIKRAVLEDLPIVQRLGYDLLEYERQRWDNTLNPNWPFSEAGERSYKNAISERYTILAFLDKQAVGFLIGTIQVPPAESARNTITANLNNIYVDESKRNQNIGSKLFEAFREYCQENNVETINVTVNSQNIQAIKFYEKCNFISSRIIMSNHIPSTSTSHTRH